MSVSCPKTSRLDELRIELLTLWLVDDAFSILTSPATEGNSIYSKRTQTSITGLPQEAQGCNEQTAGSHSLKSTHHHAHVFNVVQTTISHPLCTFKENLEFQFK